MVCERESVRLGRHQPRDGARGRHARDVVADRHLRPSPTRHPLGNNPQRALEPLVPQVAPDRGTVSNAARPLLVQPGQVTIERARARAERLVTLAAQDLAHCAAAVAGPTHDLLDRHARVGQLLHHGVVRLATTVSRVAQALRRREQRRVDRGRVQHRLDLRHAGASRRQERVARVGHQVPPIGDLPRSGQRTRGGQRVGAAPVACHHLNLRLCF